MQARRGELVDVLEGSGLVGELGARSAGLITWLADPDGHAAEIRAVAVDAFARRRGVGRALLGAAHDALGAAGIRSVWLVTTNDNIPAIRLYESQGYRIGEIRRGAIDALRRTIKPSIPLAGHGGLAIHDEIELRRRL